MFWVKNIFLGMDNFSDESEDELFGGKGHKETWTPVTNKESYEHYGARRHRERMAEERKDEEERTRIWRLKQLRENDETGFLNPVIIDPNPELKFGENNELINSEEYNDLQAKFGGGSTPLRVFKPTIRKKKEKKAEKLIKKTNKALKSYSEKSPLLEKEPEDILEGISFYTPSSRRESIEPNMAASNDLKARIKERTFYNYTPTKYGPDDVGIKYSQPGINLIKICNCF